MSGREDDRRFEWLVYENGEALNNKAYSQDIGHETPEITDRLYGRLRKEDVKAVVTKSNSSNNDHKALFRDFLEWMESKNSKLKK